MTASAIRKNSNGSTEIPSTMAMAVMTSATRMSTAMAPPLVVVTEVYRSPPLANPVHLAIGSHCVIENDSSAHRACWGCTMRWESSYPPDETTAADARRSAVDVLTRAGIDAPVVEAVQAIVAELAGNAIRHARTDYTVTVTT